MDKKLIFLYASIADVVDTIRAIDNKLLALIAVLILPLTQINVLVAAHHQIMLHNQVIGVILSIISALSWLLSMFFSGIGILSLGNPTRFIINDRKAKGVFYGAGQNSFDVYTVAIGRIHEVKAGLNEMMSNHNLSSKKIFKELVFEKMKLVCIRDLKMARQRLALLSLGLHLLIDAIVLIFACCMAIT